MVGDEGSPFSGGRASPPHQDRGGGPRSEPSELRKPPGEE